MKIIVHALLALTLTAPGRALAGDPGPVRSDERGPCGQAYRVRSAGTVAYVALDSGIDILDLTNPDRPWRLAHVPLAAPVLDLAIRDGLLVAADLAWASLLWAATTNVSTSSGVAGRKMRRSFRAACRLLLSSPATSFTMEMADL